MGSSYWNIFGSGILNQKKNDNDDAQS